MDRNRKMLKMIEKNNSWRLILAMIRIAIYGITGIAVNLYILMKAASGDRGMGDALALWILASILAVIGIEIASTEAWKLAELSKMKALFPELSEYSKGTLSHALKKMRKLEGSGLLKGPEDEIASLEIENIILEAQRIERRAKSLDSGNNGSRKKLFTSTVQGISSWIRKEAEKDREEARRKRKDNLKKTNQYLEKKGLPGILDTRKEKNG